MPSVKPPADGANAGPSRRLKPSQVLAVLGAVIGLLVGVTTLTDWFVSKTSDPAPKRIDSQILRAKAQNERLRLIDYLRDTGQSAKGLSRQEAREEGLVFAVRVRLGAL